MISNYPASWYLRSEKWVIILIIIYAMIGKVHIQPVCSSITHRLASVHSEKSDIYSELSVYTLYY